MDFIDFSSHPRLADSRLALDFSAFLRMRRSMRERFPWEAIRIAKLRDRLEAKLVEICDGPLLLGQGVPRLANTSLMIFPDSEGEMLVHHLLDHGIVASTGVACSYGSDRPSHVVTSMGVG